jgi:ribonucleotide monophosphatase NagD (HAD superfamily)
MRVGDNPYTDFAGAKNLGMRTVRMLCGEFKSVKLGEDYETEIELNSFEDMLKFTEEG